jgi:hypothetical protein
MCHSPFAVIHFTDAAATSGNAKAGHFRDNRRFGKILENFARAPFANGRVLIKDFWISQSFRGPNRDERRYSARILPWIRADK